MDNIKEKPHAFITTFKNKYEDKIDSEIKDWADVKEVISFFIDAHDQNTIVDFIDLSSWDCVERYQFDDEQKMLELVWHDFQKRIKSFKFKSWHKI